MGCDVVGRDDSATVETVAGLFVESVVLCLAWLNSAVAVVGQAEIAYWRKVGYHIWAICDNSPTYAIRWIPIDLPDLPPIREGPATSNYSSGRGGFWGPPNYVIKYS